MARPLGHGPDFESRRQEIIDDAARIFAKQGYAATGILDLCKEVGLGKGALYYYIGSKEQLLVEIQSRVLSPLLEAANRIEKLPVAAMVRLRLVSQQLIDGILERLDHVWVYEHDYRHLSGENRSRFRAQRKQFEQIVQQLLIDATTDGDLAVDDPRLATLQFLNLHNHTYQWARSTMPWDASNLSTTYFRTLMLGFGASTAGVEAAETAARKLLDHD
ncbi:TetR/AcrR family transcriptional regulator [uncultured Aeromicrobium sp.]|uniref:TetR/AcrR family transcriptional regulator n=1 Tax=uncultured Aeromicrobium sp. TaxID=337820 RepID=UPI0025E2E7A8|nr:TetR/AcrR family transcriptional regulator [uncultured Aeromicrobium sp.]